MRSRGPILATFCAVALAGAAPAEAGAELGIQGRDAEPIVLSGSDVPKLTGADPGSIVAFGWDGEWTQVPVQVDERAIVDYAAVRQNHQTSGRPFATEAYTDAGTFAGPDPDPTLDQGDEIAFMAKDAGADATDRSSPGGVAAGTRTAVAISDPLDPGPKRFVYLFRSDAGLDPSAGRSYVDYDFSLDSGDYKTTYDFSGASGGDSGDPTDGPYNTENSTVETAHYSEHLLARWVADRMYLKDGNAPGTDILDGDKAQVARQCGRSEVTFSRGGGGFIANKNGPVRAIRSYIGANSGTYTQRDDIFYQRRQDTLIYLRVHAGISKIEQYMDYSPAAVGMTYRNSAYPDGVPVDGSPDVPIPTPAAGGVQPWADWQQVSGPQGSVTTVARLDTTIPNFTAGFFYRDLGAGPFDDFLQCGTYADDLVYGASGSEYSSSGPNTDPTLGTHYDLTSSRSIFFDAPNSAGAVAARHAEQVDDPLIATAAAEGEPGRPALELTVRGGKRKVRPGRGVRIAFSLRNAGAGAATGVEVCARAPKRIARTGRCRRVSSLEAGKRFRAKLRVSAKRRAQGRIRVVYRADADNAHRDRYEAKLRVR